MTDDIRHRNLTDVGAATPTPGWCLPNTEPRWERLTEEHGGGMVRMWPAMSPVLRVGANRLKP